MSSDLTALLSLLVAADSVNPSLVPGGAGEHEVAGLIEGWARDAGLETERLEETPGRPSVLVRARHGGRSDSSAVRAHRHGQRRGDDDGPTALEIEDGGTEDEAIAALLHDAAEPADPARAARLSFAQAAIEAPVISDEPPPPPRVLLRGWHGCVATEQLLCMVRGPGRSG